ALSATDGGRYAGTFGHIGVFSLNYHKHIHTGEGGMCVTDDDDLAVRLQLIRNHAENIVEPMDMTNLTNMVGFNFRMTELLAAVFPFNLSNVRYERGLCPVAERMHDRELLCYETCSYDVTEEQRDLLKKAMRKVHAHRGRLARV